jgi:hypothetical protein
MAWGLRLSRSARSDKARPKKAPRFKPGFEQLEARDVPTVTVSLASGVLTINGSTGNDSIVLSQSNGRVSISGITSTYASTSINSVVVNDGAANDSVTLNGLKAQPWSKAVTVNSSSGEETVKLLDGRTCYFSGTNQQLATNSSGVVSLNGKALDWFDLNVHDAALRQLLKTDFADKALNRNEMLGVFTQVEKDGTVSSNEFNDLKAVANNASLFGSFTYVTDLTRDVVLGSAANAHFQGAVLGNLTAGSAASKLDKLVNKWFLGTDHPDASYSGLTVTYQAATGTLFGTGGPHYTDVHQGAVGDCYFVATLGEIALRSPSAIQNMFIVNGDGTYTVRFLQNGVAHFVTVDSQLPTYGGGYFLYANMGGYYSDSTNVLWVALAEKAYVQMNEAGWLRPTSWGGGINAYSGIEGGYFDDVVHQVVNHACTDYSVNGASDATTLNNAWTSGKLIGFASMSTPADARIVGDHQYFVVGYNSTTQTVTLFNPWGIDNGSAYPGLINLTLSQLTANFDFWSVG